MKSVECLRTIKHANEGIFLCLVQNRGTNDPTITQSATLKKAKCNMNLNVFCLKKSLEIYDQSWLSVQNMVATQPCVGKFKILWFYLTF